METGSASLARPQAAEVGDFVPFETLQGDPACGFVVVCDHADNSMPGAYQCLGLPPSEFSRHTAFDPGAAAVARVLSRRLEAPAVLANFSRLLIDPNRGEDDPTLIMRVSDGTIVPGNRSIDGEERAHRIARFYAPYHAQVARTIEAGLASTVTPAVISIHSFTPVWRGRPRPWHAGVLWDRDPRLARPLIDLLRADGSLIVGDNEPYTGRLAHDSMNRHATLRGIAHALIEIRQDLIADDAAIEAWAARLTEVLSELNRSNEIHQVKRYHSATDANGGA